MAAQMLTLNGEKFVVIPEREYRELRKRKAPATRPTTPSKRQSAEDAADIAEIERIKADPTQKPIPWAEAKKRLR
jgi:hypothetical protein